MMMFSNTHQLHWHRRFRYLIHEMRCRVYQALLGLVNFKTPGLGGDVGSRSLRRTRKPVLVVTYHSLKFETVIPAALLVGRNSLFNV